LGMAKHSATSMTTVKRRVVTAPVFAVLSEFIRGFILYSFQTPRLLRIALDDGILFQALAQ
jgi:hypothetical protein